MSQLEFKYPMNFIYFIIPIISLILLILAHDKKEKIMHMLNINSKIRFKALRIILIAAGMSLMSFALLGPQVFQGLTDVKKTGMDIYVLVDTSKSMMTEDIAPNRISRAKKIIESIIANLKGDRIGFIPFSSDAYIQMPLTDDYQLAGMFLDVIDTDMIGGGGTNIGAAIKLASDSFDRSSSYDRVLIILSDGEEHDSKSADILKNINNKGLKIYTIGIGTQKGGLIPMYDSKDKQVTSYKKDNQGDFVTSRLASDTLKELAKSGNGAYYQSSISGDEISSLMKELSSLKKGLFASAKVQRFNQIYQYFLGPGLLLVLIACFLPERSKME